MPVCPSPRKAGTHRRRAVWYRRLFPLESGRSRRAHSRAGGTPHTSTRPGGRGRSSGQTAREGRIVAGRDFLQRAVAHLSASATRRRALACATSSAAGERTVPSLHRQRKRESDAPRRQCASRATTAHGHSRSVGTSPVRWRQTTGLTNWVQSRRGASRVVPIPAVDRSNTNASHGRVSKLSTEVAAPPLNAIGAPSGDAPSKN
jgi:hypothetical protein